jgi:hypothetical protein
LNPNDPVDGIKKGQLIDNWFSRLFIKFNFSDKEAGTTRGELFAFVETLWRK